MKVRLHAWIDVDIEDSLTQNEARLRLLRAMNNLSFDIAQYGREPITTHKGDFAR